MAGKFGLIKAVHRGSNDKLSKATYAFRNALQRYESVHQFNGWSPISSDTYTFDERAQLIAP